MFEHLENRVLLANDLTAGVLSITLGAGDDVVLVYVRNGRMIVETNGDTEDFAVDEVASFTIETGDGNDYVELLQTDLPASTSLGAGMDTVYGSRGNDVIDAGPGRDRVYASTGNDHLDGGRGRDIIRGGGGNDTVDYSNRLNRVRIVQDSLANDGEFGEGDYVGLDIENILGGSGNDYIRSSNAGALIDGGSGRDWLIGRAGRDTLIGGEGDDTLDGGNGADVLEPGAGNDTIDYSSRSAGVTVTGNGTADDGAPGEGDNVFGDYETLIGGSGNDTLNGTGEQLDPGTGLPIPGTGINLLIGNGGNDTLNGDTGDDTLLGGEGNDQLNGAAGLDLLVGEAGNDVMNGGDDDDTMRGGAGLDTHNGQGGTDIADFSERIVPLRISFDGRANDGATGENENLGGTTEGVMGGSGNDILVGDANDNVLIGGRGNDDLRGGDGNDTISPGYGRDTLFGGLGADIADYSDHDGDLNLTLDGVRNDGEAGEADFIRDDFEGLYGGSGNDTLVGNDADNTLRGGLGADDMTGGEGVDLADYSDADVGVIVTRDDVADDGRPDEGDNVRSDMEGMIGGDSDDTIVGTPGDDYLNGGGGDDSIDGLGGNDTIVGGPGNDTIVGGDGDDTVDYSTATGPYTINLATGQASSGRERDVIDPTIENVIGSRGNDRITGNDSNNRLDGERGNDTITGRDGDDTLVGGLGDDEFAMGDVPDGADLIIGDVQPAPATGGGFDIVDYSQRTVGVNVTVGNGIADDGEDLEGDEVSDDIEVVEGGSGDDTLTGSDNDDMLFGNAGFDSLDGGLGDDMLFGGDDDDTLIGGDGADVISGGDGIDSIFTSGDGPVDSGSGDAEMDILDVDGTEVTDD